MIKTLPTPYGRIVYEDSREGRTALIFIHGLPTSRVLWRAVIQMLPPHFRKISFDLNNYGQSEKCEQHIHHRQRAGVIDELRKALCIDQFVLIAHDLGASVAIDYMGHFGQHVQKLILLSPPVYPDFREPAIVQLLRIPVIGPFLICTLRNTLFNYGIRRGMNHPQRFTPEIRVAFADHFQGPAGRRALRRNLLWGRPAETFSGYPDIIRRITVPTLVIQGRRDPYIPHTHAERLKQDISNCRLTYIDDGAHFLPIDTPAAVAELIARFCGGNAT